LNGGALMARSPIFSFLDEAIAPPTHFVSFDTTSALTAYGPST
jgi:hypothetical protein